MNPITIKKDLYIKILCRLENSKDTINLSKDFSADPDFFLPVLNDIADGKDSPNFHILKDFAQSDKKKINYLTERAEFIFSSIAGTINSDSKQNLYKILNLPHDTGNEEIRRKWLELTEKYYASEEKNSEKREIINNAFRVLIDPEKRKAYDRKYNAKRPVEINNSVWKHAGRKQQLIFPILIIFAFGFIFQQFQNVTPEPKTEKDNSVKSTLPVKDNNKSLSAQYKSTEQIKPGDKINVKAVQKSGIEEQRRKNPGKDKKFNTTSKKNPELLASSVNVENTDNQDFSEVSAGAAVNSNGKDNSGTKKVGTGEDIKPPVRIDELLTKKHRWTIEYGLSYTNIDSTSETVELIDLPTSGGETIILPLIVNSQVDQDILISTLNLRYGLMDDLEVFGFTSMFANFQRASINNNMREKDNDFNFNSAGIGATYQILKESKYPALLATATINILDNTNFGSFDNFSNENSTDNSGSQNNAYGLNLADDYKLNYFKTLALSLTSYYTADPVVFFLEGKYIQNFKRKNNISINPGEGFSLSPQVFFIASPYLTLSWGLRFSLRGADEVNGERINPLRTRLSPLFGVSYEFRDNLIFSLDAEYVNDPDFNRATAALSLNYNF